MLPRQVPDFTRRANDSHALAVTARTGPPRSFVSRTRMLPPVPATSTQSPDWLLRLGLRHPFPGVAEYWIWNNYASLCYRSAAHFAASAIVSRGDNASVVRCENTRRARAARTGSSS